MCPVRTTWLFITKAGHLRNELPKDRSLFLTYLMEPSKFRPFNPISIASIVRKHMQATGIDTKTYGPYSIGSVSSTMAAELGNEIDKIKKHANWSLSTNTFERFYYKPPHQHVDSKKITDSIFSFYPENHTASEVHLRLYQKWTIEIFKILNFSYQGLYGQFPVSRASNDTASTR